MNRVFTPLRVGLVVLLGAGAFFVLLSMLGNERFSEKDVYHVSATFTDASGLGPKSRVQIAGIEVGRVDRIELTEDARAHVFLRIRKDVVLHTDARISKRSASLLGDFLLDIFPGTADKPRLKNGDVIAKAIALPGMEEVFVALGDVTRDIQGVTKGLNELLTSNEVGSIKEIIKSMTGVADGLNKTIAEAGGRLDSILADAQVLSGSIRDLANNQKDNVGEILGNIRTFTEQANKVISSIDSIVGSNGTELKQSVASVRDTLNQLQRTLKGAETMVDSAKGTIDTTQKIVQGVANGEGTIGKLLKDDTLANDLNTALGDVDHILGPMSRVRLNAELLGELHYRPGLPPAYDRPWIKGGVALKLITDPTFYYGVDLVSDPRGVTTQQVTSTTELNSGAVIPTVVQTVTSDQWKVSAYVSKRVGPVAFRAGVIESTGGVGMDGFLADDHIKLSADAFDFANVFAPLPRVRAQASYLFLDRFFVGLGIDDILNTKPVLLDGRFLVGTDGFVSAGVTFTDDDIRNMLKKAGPGK